jgi:hypothetical protein
VLIKTFIDFLFQKELLQSGALVQLVSKSSGCLLQVVMTSSGALAFDGNGASNSFNSKTFEHLFLENGSSQKTEASSRR